MKSFPLRSAPAALLLALTVAACGSATGGAAQTSPPAPVPAPAPMGDAAAVARARADSARLPYTEADIHFMTAMIAHHAQAVEMARLAPTRAASPAVRTLAARIINGQQDEIAIMQQWLRDRNQPVPDASAAAMHHHGAGHAMPMAGMLTDEQMRRLAQTQGATFDRLFLSYMIQHHQGAVGMVSALFGTHGAGQDETVFRFATDVNVDQTTEIARMQRMLADLILEGGAP